MKKILVSPVILSLSLAIMLAIVFLLGREDGVGGAVRVVIGSIFLLFLPGWWITKAAFEEKEIDEIERFALSFALSISVVPLCVFYLNIAGLKINEWLVWGVCIAIIICSILRTAFFSKKVIF